MGLTRVLTRERGERQVRKSSAMYMVSMGARRLLRASCVVLACSIGAQVACAATVEREGMRYEETVRVGGKSVVLNGVGVRTVAWLKGYVAGLYLAQKTSDAEQIYSQPGAKRIAVRMLLEVSSSTLAKTFSDGIRKNYKGDELEALRPRMEVFDSQVKAIPSVKKGDEIDLDFHPATGTRVLVNGKALGDAIEGDDFYVALLKMFIGERAIDKDLRTSLLGHS
jgi:hypothetical protein